MSATAFAWSHRVSYAECTLGNHIFYARYLDFLEVARGEFFRELGKPLIQLQKEDIIFPVIEAHVKYHSPARYDDVLNIRLWVTRLDRVRIGLSYQALKQETDLILDAEILHVCASVAEKPKRIPKELHDLLSRFYRQAI